jgi:hypothetical protein
VQPPQQERADHRNYSSTYQWVDPRARGRGRPGPPGYGVVATPGAGRSNSDSTISGDFASVSGGSLNTASGEATVVSGAMPTRPTVAPPWSAAGSKTWPAGRPPWSAGEAPTRPAVSVRRSAAGRALPKRRSSAGRRARKPTRSWWATSAPRSRPRQGRSAGAPAAPSKTSRHRRRQVEAIRPVSRGAAVLPPRRLQARRSRPPPCPEYPLGQPSSQYPCPWWGRKATFSREGLYLKARLEVRTCDTMHSDRDSCKIERLSEK